MSCPIPKLKRDWIGRRVRITKTMANHYGTVLFRKGMIMEVRNYYRGFGLIHRRSGKWITRVQITYIELLPKK